MQLTDSVGRNINYLRLSVTDRCNMRCFYCMPKEGVVNRGHDAVLSYEELQLIAESAVGLGIEKIRITGGEPLVRAGIVDFLARLSSLPGLRHLALTTNGLLLADMAKELYQAGVQRLNVSLDSLNPETFSEITRGGDLKRVLDGLDAAEKAGFPPPKINVVIMRGVNDAEIMSFVEMTRLRGSSIRFIEYMPVVRDEGWQRFCISGEEILQRIAASYQLEQVDKGPFAGPSRDYRIPGAVGSIGIITAVSGHFCSECNRIRVTSTGQAKGCLFSDEKTDLVPFLRPPDRDTLAQVLRGIVSNKPERHGISCNSYEHQNFSMAQIGG
ncbi:MAG: GTP 3',8-cyclase MoaA [Geobacteraceae bacterium]|nr:GTP 3',8-cyclase MoaA [Geobacteraceae bacterium]NTW81124.1 GTP 3',8-cyclase MoaA [Geobacteraceae bacterium]